MVGIRGWIEAEGTGHWFFVAFPVILLCLFIWFKGRRVCFLIPSLIISIVIINPVFYKYWDEFGLYAYWRILWVIPVIPVVAGLVPSITERIQKGWMKSIVVATGVGLVMFGGTFLYNGAGGSFVEAANAAKEPDYVVQIADRLLELEERPRVIAQDPIGVYLRQYTGEINQLFGRDLHGHILQAETTVQQTNNDINDGNWEIVSQMMLDENYDYMVVSSDPGEEYFDCVEMVEGFGIYKAKGTPHIIREKNELGQVTKVTTVDENGKPQNGEAGYASILRDYDTYNNVELEWYEDSDGEPFIQSAGHAAIKQEWEGYGKLLSRTYLDSIGNPMNRNDGYARAVWTTNQNETESVHFYDLNGNEISIYGLNLSKDISIGSDGWTKWIEPDYNVKNCCFYIGTANLGEKQEGDSYTCQIEIEFKDVSFSTEGKFLFQTQGDVDGVWNMGSIWYPNVIELVEPMADGIYNFTSTVKLSKLLSEASWFSIGFRCDYWGSGSFRVRNIKIEKGDKKTVWTPGL